MVQPKFWKGGQTANKWREFKQFVITQVQTLQFREFRDRVWKASNQVLAQFQGGQILEATMRGGQNIIMNSIHKYKHTTQTEGNKRYREREYFVTSDKAWYVPENSKAEPIIS